MFLGSFASLPLRLQLASIFAVALLFVYLFGLSFPWSAASASHSAEGTLAIYWMHRTHTVPYRKWFLPSASELSGTALDALAKEGNVVMPLHAIYLWVLGHGVQLLTTATLPRTLNSSSNAIGSNDMLVRFWDANFFAFLDDPSAASATKEVGETVFAVRWVTSLLLMPLLFQVAVEVLWPLLGTLAAHYVSSARQRGEAVRAFTGDTQPSEVPSSQQQQQQEMLIRAVTSVGFMAAFTLVVLPTMALELTTLHPVCLCTCALMRCVHLLVQDEDLLTSPESYTRERFSNRLEDKLFQQGGVVAFPLKKPLTLSYVCQAAVLLAAVGLTLRPCLFIVSGLVVWTATLCYVRVHRRVLVRVQVPEGAPAPEAADDGFVDIGSSSYRDVLFANMCLCRATSWMIALAAVVCVPFWCGQQDLFTFMDLLAPRFHPERSFYARSGTTSGNSHHDGIPGASMLSPYLTMTGAGELTEACLHSSLSLPRPFTCGRPPLVSVFTLCEYFGVPVTKLTVSFASLIATSENAAQDDAAMWTQYVSVITLVGANLVPVLVVLAYRIRRPPTSFDTPVAFATEYVKQKERFFHYWAQQADSVREQRRYPPPERPFAATVPTPAPLSPEEAGKTVVRTCICQEEYILKQTTALLWVLMGLAITCNLFLVRSGTSLALGSSVLLPAGLLYATQAMIDRAAASEPQAFNPVRNRRRYDALAGEQTSLAHAGAAGRERARQGSAKGRHITREDTSGSSRNDDNKIVEDLTLASPSIPLEHQTRRTFACGSFRYTTPAFNAEGTGWSLASRWCSPAALGEHTDAVWALVAIVAVAVVVFQTHPIAQSASSDAARPSLGFSFTPTPLWSRSNGSTLALAALTSLLVYELVACRAWLRRGVLTAALLILLQAGGVFATVSAFFPASQDESSSAVTGDNSVAAGAVRWLSGLADTLTGPRVLFDLLNTFNGAAAAASGGYSWLVWRSMYRSLVASACLFLACVHASLRLSRLLLESEEVSFADAAKEMEQLHVATKKARQQQ